jgi:aldehyde dehydrogenase (NAD+)
MDVIFQTSFLILLSLMMIIGLEEIQTLETIKRTFASLQKTAYRLRVEPLLVRKQRLKAIRNWILLHRSVIHEAMFNDFQKAALEVDGIEIFHVLSEIKHALQHLEKWATPEKVDAPITLLGTRSFIQYEPKGVCLIISPWNYPFSLAVGPLVSALAAGNCAIIKPSELTPHVSAVIKKMVSEIFEENVVTVFEGGPEISQYLLTLPFDHIFFTGSPSIGRKVMRAASENLSSITLELGGKSPTIVADSANLKDAAERIAVAKFVNNGQTCVAPDYVYADEKIIDRLISHLISKTKKLFSEKDGDFKISKSYCRIVNEKHFDRLNELLQNALNQGAKLEFGGLADRGSRFMPPVILTKVSLKSRLMEEEIFGPILPVIPYKNIHEVIAHINSNPKPLALYLFTKKESLQKQVLQETSSGAVCINDCGIQFLHHNLPFGGVNNSGIGKSHGYYGFLAFSNEKSVLKQKSGITTVKAFYPPYTTLSKKIMDWFLKLF